MATASRKAVVLAAAALVLTSCAHLIDGHPVASQDLLAAAKTGELKCNPVDAPLVTVPRVDADEPTIKIPQPPGWDRIEGRDNDLLRYTMINKNLQNGNFSPTIVIALESVADAMTPDEVFAAQRKSISTLGVPESAMEVDNIKICGLPAQTVNYQLPQMGVLQPHPATALFVAYRSELRTYCAGLTVQTTAPDNLIYKRDSEMMVSGFQVLPVTHP
ncbi:LpqN/LpqT family lipoprotein [Mycobacterium sp. 155]|uniref:LpqN/LpqT family lipoprotein n=1 Tax=Mycobacterium sp. 155 TaxID=1157943 RepID=UPI0004775BB5|nr:LpqN/LpqT family lipoprotein [Mycobacterium sp. 155]